MVTIIRQVPADGTDTISAMPGVKGGSLALGGGNGPPSADISSPGSDGVPVDLWIPCWSCGTGIISAYSGSGGTGFDNGVNSTAGGNGGAVSLRVGDVSIPYLYCAAGGGGNALYSDGMGGNGGAMTVKAIENLRCDYLTFYNSSGGTGAAASGAAGSVVATIYDLGPVSSALTNLTVNDNGLGSLRLVHSRVTLTTNGVGTLTYGNNVMGGNSMMYTTGAVDMGGNSTGW
ncbi:MAG: hypothetical protein JWO08_606 [Verrucomicrobiaceae bacterium]|nr:hypothetical protein [Verrucomicrobiaceae bacterium]